MPNSDSEATLIAIFFAPHPTMVGFFPKKGDFLRIGNFPQENFPVFLEKQMLSMNMIIF